jgi:hypothetical protein
VKQSSTVANAFANGMVGGDGPEPNSSTSTL